eukprot:m.185152 g.185152  ORF g.185152 m.185152 type:complete len:64 (+) comp16679_c9_seq1:890-1081(+)
MQSTRCLGVVGLCLEEQCWSFISAFFHLIPQLFSFLLLLLFFSSVLSACLTGPDQLVLSASFC